MSIENPLISVIIPVYKVEKYLDKCVESVCNQTYTNLEIILVDDGSPDNCGALCDQWKKRDNRIVVIHKENGGLSDARNAALDVAHGDYIAFLDSDDYIAPGMYEDMLERLWKDASDLVVCAYKTVDEEGNSLKQIYDDIPDEIVEMKDYLILVHQNERIHCTLSVVWNKLYKREYFEKVRFKRGVIHEDEFLLNQMIPRINKISFMHSAYHYYLQRSGSIMHVPFSSKRLAYYYALKERIQICINLGMEEACYQPIVRECLDRGVRFWFIMSVSKTADADEIREFYKDVQKTKRAYSRYGSFKQKLLWNAFDYCPAGLKLVYKVNNKIKRKSI